MTEVEVLARFVSSIRYEDLSKEAIEQLKLRVLDSLGVAFGALSAEPIREIRGIEQTLGGNPRCTLIGAGKSAPDRAAFYNGALVRYLDFMDSTITPAETFHSSDNLGAILAAAEYADISGRDFLVALALAYEIQYRLSTAAPVRARGFDHTTQGAFAVAAGISKALGLDAVTTANAIAMSGTANIALRVTRTGALSHWKGLAYANTAFSATHCAFLALAGITGPPEVFEGNKGFHQSVAGPFKVDWESTSFEGIRRSILKKYNAEIHSQSALEAALELREEHAFTGSDVQSVELETFQVAFDIIGGGEEGLKEDIRSKEDADHSLRYMIAAALLDGELYPEQYRPERIASPDVQDLLRRVHIRANAEYSRRFPDEMPARVTIHLRDGRHFTKEKSDYEGFHTRPMSRESVIAKFERLSRDSVESRLLTKIEEIVDQLPELRIRELSRLLSQIQIPEKKETPMPKDSSTEKAFSFVPMNSRPPKPRTRGMTEIRGPYYSVMGKRYLSDVLETMGEYVDGLKFAGGSFSLMPRERVKELIDLAHSHDVYVSTGGWIERVLCYGPEAVNRYMEEVKSLGFDVIELSVGFISMPADDLLRLVDRAASLGLKPKPELGIQFGAGGATAAEELETEGTRDVGWLTGLGRRCLDAGASILMIESEGITESVKSWRLEVPTQIINELGAENVMFEAAEPAVFEWYVKNYGNDVNLFVDHSQIVQLEALRSGIWGTKSSWGRIVTYPETRKAGSEEEAA